MELLHVGDALVEVHVDSLRKRQWKDVLGGVGVEAVDDLEWSLLRRLMNHSIIGKLGMGNALFPMFEVGLD